MGKVLWRTLLVVGSVALLVTFAPRSESTHYDFSVGKPWYDSPIIAKETFPLLKADSLLEAELTAARRSYKPIYEMDPKVKTSRMAAFSKYFDSTLASAVPPDYKKYLLTKLGEMYDSGIVSTETQDALRGRGTKAITISIKNEGRTQPTPNLYTRKTAYEHILHGADSLGLDARVLQRSNISNFIEENLTYDKERSESLLASVEGSVSKYKGEIQAGQEIVHRGQIVTPETYLALRSMETFYTNVQKKTRAERLSQMAGQTLYVGIIVICLLLYFTEFRPEYLRQARVVLFVMVLGLLFPLVTYTLVKHVPTPFIAFVVPFCLVPIFVKAFMDSRTAYITHLSCILLCALAVSYPFEFIATELVGGLVATYSIKQLTQRSELFWAVVSVTLSSLTCYLCFDLVNMSFFRSEGIEWAPYYYILAGGGLLLISYLLLFPFEKLFHFTSNVTLIELSNTTGPLLRLLSEEAPGTFQHSLQVANLAAEVAGKIGANPQLVRTAALYHDIGKLRAPNYFTENQAGVNPHDELSPVESARIIVAHVKDGLEIAEKYKLPQVIRHFISTHHGTSKAKYFYLTYRQNHPGEEIDERPFTYPGPDPSTMEQAILMMADAVEASSRSLKEYTEQNVNDLVDRIVDGQVQEGHFSECPITFQDISEAKQVFKEKLKTIYHTRISYPVG